jgi:testis-specific serine kinase
VKAKHESQNSEESVDLACKIIDKKRKGREKTIINDLKNISHPHIVALHSMLQNNQFLFVFFQWTNEGNLLQYVRDNGSVPEVQAKNWFNQIASALKFLHIRQVAHCNLSCKSILICEGNVKISGLTYILKVENDQKVVLKLKKSLLNFYRAPEVNLMNACNPFKADVFSIGVVLFIILNAMVPFSSQTLNEIIGDQLNRRFFIRQSIMHELSIDCQITIHALLEPDAEKRWNIEKVLAMKWLSSCC